MKPTSLMQIELEKARATIRALEDELSVTNSGVIALALELEQAGAEASILQELQDELKTTNSGLVALALELDERTLALELATRELESFSYSVSHDLRAPLRALCGYSKALIDHHADALDEEGQMFVKRIGANAQRMEELISGLLDLSRYSRAELRRLSVDLSSVAHSVAEDLYASFPEQEVEFYADPELRAVGDPILLRAVLMNLLGNAWKFSAGRAVARIEAGSRDSDGETVFFVKDNGVGFDPAFADRLFTAFCRLHDEREFGGTGIGLATVQRIIHRHGGRVWATSVPSEGATFFFTLPADYSEAGVDEGDDQSPDSSDASAVPADPRQGRPA